MALGLPLNATGFRSSGFHEKDGKAYCRKDYFDMFAPKCGGCARAILENYISALNTLWHPECFVCRVRGTSIQPEGLGAGGGGGVGVSHSCGAWVQGSLQASKRAGLGYVYVCSFMSQKSSAGVETRSQVEVFLESSSVQALGLVTLDRACDDQMTCNKS